MIMPDEDEDMEYFDDDLNSFSTPDTVLSEAEDQADFPRVESAIDVEGFTGFKSVPPTPQPAVSGGSSFLDETISLLRHDGGGDAGGGIGNGVEAESVKSKEAESVKTTTTASTVVTPSGFSGFTGFQSVSTTTPSAGGGFSAQTSPRHNGGGDVNGNVEMESNEPVAEPVPEFDVFGRSTAKGRSNWFTSEYGSNFRLMDGDLLPREFTKPVRKATTDIKYIRGLYTADICLKELSVGEDTKRVGWGTFFKGDADAWNVWNSEWELSTLTTLDVQRNVAAAVNSRRKMKWAIGVERNGMVTGVQFNDGQKDILRQAIDFALCREFVPELDPRIVKVEFIRVSAVTGNRSLVLITINSLVESLHQLSSGRIFYLVGDKVVMAESMNQIRLALEERMRHDSRVVKENGLGVKGKRKIRTWVKIAGGVAVVVGAVYAVKRWIK